MSKENILSTTWYNFLFFIFKNVFFIGKIKCLITIKSRYLRFEPTRKYNFRTTNKFVSSTGKQETEDPSAV